MNKTIALLLALYLLQLIFFTADTWYEDKCPIPEQVSHY